jgi:predicted ATP-dependent serine protease
MGNLIGCSVVGWCPDRWCCSGGDPGIGKSTLLLQQLPLDSAERIPACST